jgi:myosin heavy subunit
MLILFFQEYLDDGIDWASVEFVDNTDCLSLFEKVYCFSSHGLALVMDHNLDESI